MEIVQISPLAAENLIQELDRYQAALYPSESNHLDCVAALSQKNAVMFGVMECGTLLAIGAVKRFKGYGEIKRVFVPEKHRGKGLAKMVMAALEKHLVENGIFCAKLETGILQHEALGLYRKLGYKECQAFSPYQPDTLSVFMTKTLNIGDQD